MTYLQKILNSEIIFKITDLGIGIPPDDLPHIFGSFHRASNIAIRFELGMKNK